MNCHDNIRVCISVCMCCELQGLLTVYRCKFAHVNPCNILIHTIIINGCFYTCTSHVFCTCALTVLHVPVGDSGEDSFFDISGEVISEMAPKPHPLAAEGSIALAPSQCSSASSANHSNEGGTFPQLDSNLLQVLCFIVNVHMHSIVHIHFYTINTISTLVCNKLRITLSVISTPCHYILTVLVYCLLQSK